MGDKQTAEPKLMPISIPRLWAVGDNKFYDVDPIRDEEPGSDFIVNSTLGFMEDILWLFEWRYELDEDDMARMVIPEHDYYSIDLGWYPNASINGSYRARLLWNGADQIEVDVIISRSRVDIRDKMEQWMLDILYNYQEAHKRFARDGTF